MANKTASRSLSALNRRLLVRSILALDRADAILARRMIATVAVRTGDLRNSIDVAPARDSARGVVGGVTIDDPAWAPVEFGTDEMSPQPFIRPAIATERRPMEAAITATLRKAP